MCELKPFINMIRASYDNFVSVKCINTNIVYDIKCEDTAIGFALENESGSSQVDTNV